MQGTQPLVKHGQVRWYQKVQKGNTYLVSLDPCLGTGGDFAAIQVFSLPDFKQVAEWQHNKTPIQGQVRVMHSILKEINQQLQASGTPNPEIYWTIENNTLGEAAIVTVDEMGEDKFPGYFLHEPRKGGQQRRVVRKGYNTTNKSKVTACSKLKAWVESDKITLFSKPLIRELKVFVAKGNSFEAKSGENDDLVSALLLVVRMTDFLTKYDATMEESLGARLDDDDDHQEPMPIII